jgi:enoyl-CoA hydratase
VNRSGSDALVLAERQGAVALITLNRPASRNALNVALATAFVEAMHEHADAGAIVITGADPAFCAGLDLRDLGTEHLRDLPRCAGTVMESIVPVIAAVNGPAVTGGFELALACDFIVASTNAAFADTHLRVGVYPGPVLVDLPRRVGMACAREMTLTGNFVDAGTALRIGLANHVVAHEELVPFTLALAHAIAEQDRTMVATARRDWDETSALPIAAAHRRHRQIAADAGYAVARRGTLQQNMANIVERSRAQRLGGTSGRDTSVQ